MASVKTTIEVDQRQINRIKTALKVETDQEAIQRVLDSFDIEKQLMEATLVDAGTFNFEKG